MNKTLHTIWGNANKNNHGYYVISTSKEGNRGKALHRLIYETFFGFKVPKNYVVHHKDGDKTNNCILNLQLMREFDHRSLHNKGKIISEEHKQRISEANKGNQYTLGFKHSEESKKLMSKAKKGNKNRLGKYHSEESKRKMSKSHMGNRARAKYTLWDVSKIVYDKSTMYKNNKKGLFPKLCFRTVYNKYRLPIGTNYDFLTCEIINNLIEEECG